MKKATTLVLLMSMFAYAGLKRSFDFLTAIFSLILFSPVLIIVWILVRATSAGPVLYWSDRVGKDNEIFKMPKFRTMKVETPQLATHLISDPGKWLTPIGNFLRRTSLDELPQLWSILIGNMSFVGPRPALYNQDDLIQARTARGVHEIMPGLTGWAQINGRDELPIPIKVDFDQQYLNNRSFLFDMKIILLTIFKVFNKEGVSH